MDLTFVEPLLRARHRVLSKVRTSFGNVTSSSKMPRFYALDEESNSAGSQ